MDDKQYAELIREIRCARYEAERARSEASDKGHFLIIVLLIYAVGVLLHIASTLGVK